jgi:hypothetical protein
MIANIRLFYHAMKTENRLSGFEERLWKFEKTEKILKEKTLFSTGQKSKPVFGPSDAQS